MRAFSLLVILCASPAARATDNLGTKVVEFARANAGVILGNGECVALAHQALKAAGAKPRAHPDNPGKGDYVWGELVLTVEGSTGAPVMSAGLDAIRPGDIAQLRDAVFPKSHYSHHTAVVTGRKDGHVYLLQQNVNGRKDVRRGSMRIDLLKSGWVRFYRPLPRR